ncbi:hypothetical protein FQR65_LT16634 [Abscondita terminalis]|nr:hypothetical protein FQR65_LT16634 [Abscondita terminalis]
MTSTKSVTQDPEQNAITLNMNDNLQDFITLPVVQFVQNEEIPAAIKAVDTSAMQGGINGGILWLTFANEENARGNGPPKTGGGPSCNKELTDLEERLFNLISKIHLGDPLIKDSPGGCSIQTLYESVTQDPEQNAITLNKSVTQDPEQNAITLNSLLPNIVDDIMFAFDGNEVIRSINSGAERDDIYKPKVYWFPLLKFLDKTTDADESQSNLDLQSENSQTSIEINEGKDYINKVLMDAWDMIDQPTMPPSPSSFQRSWILSQQLQFLPPEPNGILGDIISDALVLIGVDFTRNY